MQGVTAVPVRYRMSAAGHEEAGECPRPASLPCLPAQSFAARMAALCARFAAW